jgi:hypothetical protein
LRAGVAFEVLEEECGAAGSVVPTSRKIGEKWGTLCGGAAYAFADAVGDFGDFQDGVDFGLDAFEFAGAVEGGDPLTEVVEGQRGLLERMIIPRLGSKPLTVEVAKKMAF